MYRAFATKPQIKWLTEEFAVNFISPAVEDWGPACLPVVRVSQGVEGTDFASEGGGVHLAQDVFNLGERHLPSVGIVPELRGSHRFL